MMVEYLRPTGPYFVLGDALQNRIHLFNCIWRKMDGMSVLSSMERGSGWSHPVLVQNNETWALSAALFVNVNVNAHIGGYAGLSLHMRVFEKEVVDLEPLGGASIRRIISWWTALSNSTKFAIVRRWPHTPRVWVKVSPQWLSNGNLGASYGESGYGYGV